MTLTGTVPWQYQREAAEKTITQLFGVKGVSNGIVVKAPVATTDVRRRIEEAFKRSADMSRDALLQFERRGAGASAGVQWPPGDIGRTEAQYEHREVEPAT